MLDALIATSTFVMIIGCLGDVIFGAMYRRYARGTYQRYLYATYDIVANFVSIVGMIIFTYSAVASGYAFVIFMTIPTASVIVYSGVKVLRTEDNWFNDRWNKLKQAIKKAYKAATSVHINVPRPATA